MRCDASFAKPNADDRARRERDYYVGLVFSLLLLDERSFLFSVFLADRRPAAARSSRACDAPFANRAILGERRRMCARDVATEVEGLDHRRFCFSIESDKDLKI